MAQELSHFTTPAASRCFEDYVPGAVYEFGSVAIGEDEIVEFGKRYDPQYLHVDPQGAAAGPFGGLIASGWQTSALIMRLFVEHYLPGAASLASPGIDELRWLKPVRPGDVLRVRITTLETRRSKSKADRGLVRSRVEAFNQRDELVASLVGTNFIACRAG
ncbi:MAG: MaoC family dehydratase [Candidatus Baltobacteraceae bacterium]